MDEPARDYVVMPRPGVALPDGWQEVLADLRGVTVQGRTPARLQMQATGAALEEVRRRFGDGLLIEAASGRSFAP